MAKVCPAATVAPGADAESEADAEAAAAPESADAEDEVAAEACEESLAVLVELQPAAIKAKAKRAGLDRVERGIVRAPAGGPGRA